MPRSLLVLALLVPSLVSLACGRRGVQVTTAPSAAATMATPERTRLLLTALAHDSMEGRGTGQPGSVRAARFIAAQMRAAGLEPAGDSGYFQRVPVAITTRRVRMANGEERERTGPVLLPSLEALDTVPAQRRVTAVNVLGVLRGSDPALASEVVVVGAHYDHVGIGRAVGGDSIYNGADDDASGVVTTLEVARILAAGTRPRRTIVFATFTGEEVGGLGVRWYTTHPVAPIEQHVADLQIEMTGRPDSLAGGAGRGWLTGYERSTMGERFTAAGLPIVADPRPDQSFFTRSDNIHLARLGVPAHTLSSFNLHREYHSPDDEVELVDFAHMSALINVAAEAVRLLADGPRPEWKPGGRPQPPNRP
ncbi:MAG TPA: M20/M25/M40 family metallo-hydrolase [Gemmatimonadaceae bacterium]